MKRRTHPTNDQEFEQLMELVDAELRAENVPIARRALIAQSKLAVALRELFVHPVPQREPRDGVYKWMSRRFPPQAKYVSVFECGDVTQLLGRNQPSGELMGREGLLFGSRDHAVPAPRKELVILTSVLASYSVERLITSLERDIAPRLDLRPHQRLLIGDDLRVIPWGQSSTEAGEAETEPCDVPPPIKDVA